MWLFEKTGGRTLGKTLGFPGSSDAKESACNVGGLGLTLGLGRSPGGGHCNSLQSSCLENSIDRGTWQATVHGVTKSQTRLSTAPHRRQDLRHSCLLQETHSLRPLLQATPSSQHNLTTKGGRGWGVRNSDGSKGLWCAGLTHQHSPGFSCDLVKSVPVSVKWRVQGLFREANVRPRQVDRCKVPTRGLAQTEELGSRKPLPASPAPILEGMFMSE